MIINPKKIKIGIGFPLIVTMFMYFSYVDQIMLNMNGQRGSFILPLLTVLNCVVWIIYGASREKRSWSIIICNIPGVILGIITVFTALVPFS